MPPEPSRCKAAADLERKMGALTDQLKRSSTDLRLPLSSASPKKPRLVLPSFPSISPNTPKSLPFRRDVHAPQHIIHAFGLGSSSSRRRPPRTFEMGNLFSVFSSKKQDERTALDVYKKMVERFGSPSNEVVRVSSVQRKSPDLATRNEEEMLDGSDIVSDKVDDGGNAALELVRMRKGGLWAKSEPLYKKLYQKTKEYDIRLNDLIFEADVLQRKAAGCRSVLELLQEKKPKLDLNEPFRLLTTEEEEEISRALFSVNSHKVLVVHEPSNLQITKDILQCLSPRAWLNDEVINLYLELLKEREKREPKKFLKCHFFNTFFYKRLTSGKHGYDFKSVKRWTTQKKLGYALIECEKIFVPIHKEIHWCLAVINVKDESFQYLDSLGGTDNFVLKTLARYLKDEVCDKSGREIDTLSWKKESVDELPLQKNGWDCGMFMLKYADFYSRGLNLCFSQEDMAYFRKRTALEILRLKAG